MKAPDARQHIDHLDSLAVRRAVEFAPGRCVCWRVYGTGDPLVLLHGGHGNWLHWVRNIEPLARNRQVLVADIPGFGDSDALPAVTSMQDIANAIATSLDRLLGARRLVDIAGFSFGGVVSARIAASRGAVRRLSLIGSPANGTPERQSKRLIRWCAFEGEAQDEALRHNLLARMLFHEASVDSLGFECYADGVRRTRFRSRGLAGAVPLAEILRDYPGDVQFVWGENDVTATLSMLSDRLIRGRPNRHLRIVPHGGHWIQYECAQAFNDALIQWLDRPSIAQGQSSVK
jgi:pimeloyl-ACP methyl ester carboxylesterase